MHILLGWNEKLVSVIAQYIKGPLGIVVHAIILALIFGVIGFLVN